MDIDELVEAFGGFHDSCIKSVEYVSGAYVTPDLSMHAINNARRLRAIVQRQNDHLRTIELEFDGLCVLSLSPQGENATCEILDATFCVEGGQIVWHDGEDEGGTFYIRAEKARWRGVE